MKRAHQKPCLYICRDGRIQIPKKIHYKITDENIKEAIDYMDNKEHILMPFDEYNLSYRTRYRKAKESSWSHLNIIMIMPPISIRKKIYIMIMMTD